MRLIGRIILVWLGLAVMVPLAAWGGEEEKKTIQVKFKPTSIIKKGPAAAPGSKIFFEVFKNETGQLEQVGENQEKGRTTRILTADPEGPGQLVATAFRKEFQGMGFFLAESPNQADRIIGGAIVKFWSVEARSYETVVRLKVLVKDRAGKVLLTKIYAGSAKRFGRSLSQDNYNESFSDSLIDLIETLFGDRDFLQAL
jgi:hypothetical protein